MKTGLTVLNTLIIALVVMVCGLICVSYGWIAYSIITNRSGLHGSLYWYYGANKTWFAIYQLGVFLSSMFIIVRLLYFFYSENARWPKRTYLYFVLFLIVLILCEVYLDSRYVGKG